MAGEQNRDLYPGWKWLVKWPAPLIFVNFIKMVQDKKTRCDTEAGRVQHRGTCATSCLFNEGLLNPAPWRSHNWHLTGFHRRFRCSPYLDITQITLWVSLDVSLDPPPAVFSGAAAHQCRFAAAGLRLTHPRAGASSISVRSNIVFPTGPRRAGTTFVYHVYALRRVYSQGLARRCSLTSTCQSV